jgi:hypothetical protein
MNPDPTKQPPKVARVQHMKTHVVKKGWFFVAAVKKTLHGARSTPPEPSGSATALALRARLRDARSIRVTSLRDVQSPSLMARAGNCGSAAATKYVSPRDAAPYF